MIDSTTLMNSTENLIKTSLSEDLRDIEATKSAKIVMLGDSGVGKTTLVTQFINGEFKDEKQPTIGACFMQKKIKVRKEVTQLQIWDTAGQERFACMAPFYYRNAMGALIIYDVTSKESLIRARRWIYELQSNADPNTLIALVGNKIDMKEKRTVSTHQGQELANETGALFFETSALVGTNVDFIFVQVANLLPINVVDTTNLKLGNEESNKHGSNICGAC